MRNLSKSKLIAYRQCPKRLWLEIHHRDLLDLTASTQTAMASGHEVGRIAREIYDRENVGHLFDLEALGFPELLAQSKAMVERGEVPLFEAGFSANGALALADVLLPVDDDGRRAWRMVEVKSSTSVKDYHRDDVAIQAYVARSAGVPLQSIALAHVDNSWTYLGDGDYRGLLVEVDLTQEAFGREAEVEAWIADARAVAASASEPELNTGEQCNAPHPCGFLAYCSRNEAVAEFPVSWLPNIRSKALQEQLAAGVTDMREVPDDLLNQQQLRVKRCTVNQECHFDAEGAANDLADLPSPSYFLDFETSMLAVPIWPGSRPYQHIPFQFSLHVLHAEGEVLHREFLELNGDDPSRPFAEALVDACGVQGAIFVYSARFERTRIKELADRFPDLSAGLLAINSRLVDLLDIALARYYHPSQCGSWSIKKLLPAIAPDLDYGQLDGIQNGEMAMAAFQEAVSPGCLPDRKREIEFQLRQYCALDTLAMIRIRDFFRGRQQQAS